MISSSNTTTEALLREDCIEIDCFGVTDIGKQRKVNQDQFVIGDLHKHICVEQSSVDLGITHSYGNVLGKLMLVADGVGGASAGEVASELAIKSTVEYLLSSMHWLTDPGEDDVERFINDLKEAACFSHFNVRNDAASKPDHRGMGSTLTVAYIVWPMMYVLHIGDSRCYLQRNNELQLLTKDQTFAQKLLDDGYINRDQFERSDFHNVLVSAIGADGELDAIVYKQQLEPGDRLLLCSDGVNVHLSDQKIAEILSLNKSAQAISRQMVSEANDAGGRDNITAVVARFLKPKVRQLT